jgi:CheY-like chemotaxis protein
MNLGETMLNIPRLLDSLFLVHRTVQACDHPDRVGKPNSRSGIQNLLGYELIDRIRQRLPSQLPAIALTAYAGEGNEQKVVQA